MKIGVVADTHSRPIPQQLIHEFKKVDFIVHAGDFCSLDDLKAFEAINEVKAVFGNMDDPEVRKKLTERFIFSVGDMAVGVVHGTGAPQNIVEAVRKEFSNDRVDVIVFGHSHQPMNEKRDGILFFNPGSPNDLVLAPYCSYGILEIQNGQAEGKIIKVKGS